MKIGINYLPFRREHFAKLAFHFLCKAKPENKSQVEVNILTTADHGPIGRWNGLVEMLRSNGVRTNLVDTTVQDYMVKISYAVAQDIEYSIKMDEDCFINEDVWNYWIENIDVLDDDTNTLFAPMLSTGIPTCDYVVEMLDEPDRHTMRAMFGSTHIPNIWGVDYSDLNAVSTSGSWHQDNFYHLVKQINHHYKGIHPIRVNERAQNELNRIILRNVDKFLLPRQHSLLFSKHPYYCNSFFAIKTSKWRDIVSDKRLFRDDFDEVPINLHRESNDHNFVFIENSFGIHTMYNTIYGGEIPCNAEENRRNELEFYVRLERAVLG